MEKKLKVLSIIFLMLAIVGFVESTYLTAEHFRGEIPPCTIVTGCETVLTSKYSTVAGIPVALFGALYYLFLAILAVLFLDKKQTSILRLIARVTPLGFLASAFFVYLQVFVIKEICVYCMTSAVISTMLFLIGIYIIKLIKIRV
ncbi:hypothetical protein A3I25_00740 [Candidatus Nomurabacteria bacterium RIFCSPLOWO2_02_FULL_42_17]|uniref:Vitamin K epoxide reductase domain-containing protein n=2 Tax=Candidatus Nomuraibacteriota TaxID=1752729 RepID=A0A1F6WIH2_9BACT|nr:MAG: hypothetical protein A3B93_01860 [Candidatus Nomurabacteria bacterium RIFCSPHIGHO2_02_FULL_42_24]OGI96776.1 MAG: hypothetical protein A3I25_00740 [Candidatus Nomurabacteria bacterium RIFCSPLOWO2_02_FULL_42_17]